MSDPKRPALNTERIVDAALAIADADGLGAVSMRRVGAELGVEAMSLYHHVASKDELLRAVIDAVLAEIEIPDPGDDWREAMRRRAASAREVFARHPWAIGLLEGHSEESSPQRLGYYDAILGSLRKAGFEPRLAMRAFSLLDSFIYGFLLQEASLPFDDEASLDEVGADLLEQMAGAYPHLTEATRLALESGYDFSDEFDFGLDLIIDALGRAAGVG
jgi:AcrR family transcriptional regulator